MVKQRTRRRIIGFNPVRRLHARFAGWRLSDGVMRGPNGSYVMFVHSDPAHELRFGDPGVLDDLERDLIVRGTAIAEAEWTIKEGDVTLRLGRVADWFPP